MELADWLHQNETTQKQLADIAGVLQSTVSKAKRRLPILLNAAIKISNATGGQVSVHELGREKLASKEEACDGTRA